MWPDSRIEADLSSLRGERKDIVIREQYERSRITESVSDANDIEVELEIAK